MKNKNRGYIDPIIIEEGFFKSIEEHDQFLDKVVKEMAKEIKRKAKKSAPILVKSIKTISKH